MQTIRLCVVDVGLFDAIRRWWLQSFWIKLLKRFFFVQYIPELKQIAEQMPFKNNILSDEWWIKLNNNTIQKHGYIFKIHSMDWTVVCQTWLSFSNHRQFSLWNEIEQNSDNIGNSKFSVLWPNYRSWAKMKMQRGGINVKNREERFKQLIFP